MRCTWAEWSRRGLMRAAVASVGQVMKSDPMLMQKLRYLNF